MKTGYLDSLHCMAYIQCKAILDQNKGTVEYKLLWRPTGMHVSRRRPSDCSGERFANVLFSSVQHRDFLFSKTRGDEENILFIVSLLQAEVPSDSTRAKSIGGVSQTQRIAADPSCSLELMIYAAGV